MHAVNLQNIDKRWVHRYVKNRFDFIENYYSSHSTPRIVKSSHNLKKQTEWFLGESSEYINKSSCFWNYELSIGEVLNIKQDSL